MRYLLPIILFFILPWSAIAQYSELGIQTNQKAKGQHPIVQAYEEQLSKHIQEELMKIDWGRAAKASQADTPLYIIPVVVHVVHDYGTELLRDTLVFNFIDLLNRYFAKNVADTNMIIDKFKPIAANTRIAFRLARIDPNGNPTKGIDHIHSYHTTKAYDQSKLNQWPQNRYINVWVVRTLLNQNAEGSSYYFPWIAQNSPYYDGAVMQFDYVTSRTYLSHAMGHCLGLKHLCGYPGPCDDGDGIADTPPGCGDGCNLYDVSCGDTMNSQNIMNTGYCQIMFTNGQTAAMGAVLSQNIAGRSNLVSSVNRAATGMDLPIRDMLPVADFSVEKGKSTGIPPAERTYFYCANEPAVKFRFINRSWNDTITSAQFHFSNGASLPDTILTGAALGGDVLNSFSQPGWVRVSLTATGNNTGSITLTDTIAVYAADGNNPLVEDPTTLPMHAMDFNPGQTDDWPIFNYYKNDFKWQLNNSAGFYDHTCIEYVAFDSRQFPANTTGGPAGDYDDFFSRAYDLSAMAAGYCNLNFMSAGASRTSISMDTLDVSYSNDCGKTWILLHKYGGTELDNNVSLPIAYAPLDATEWKLNSIELPAPARTNKVFFRFRYKPGADANGYSTGNNYFLDRVSISNFPTGLNVLLNGKDDAVIAPNPSNGDSYVLLGSKPPGQVKISIVNTSGQLVFSDEVPVSLGRISLPTGSFPAGMYFVTISRPNNSITRKLIVSSK